MKQVIIVSVLILIVLLFILDKTAEKDGTIDEKYPWQITLLEDGRSRIFGIILDETRVKEINEILKSRPKIALFETANTLSLEAYYKNITLGGLIGSFIFTVNATQQQFDKIRNESVKKEPAGNNGFRYELDKPSTDRLESATVKNLIYLPTVNLDEKTIIQRFGEPAHKIKLKTKEQGWHYLYPEKGLDLIYKEEGKEVLQYVLPKNFNALLAPLQAH